MSNRLEALWQWDKLPYVAVGVVGLATLVIGKRLVLRMFSGKRSKVDVPNGTVMLYQFGRGTHAPSLSPFPIKLETYLRMANIPYQTNTDNIMSSKGKGPWMSFNGVEVADSQFCIDHLNKELDIDLNKHLTPEQQGITQAFRRMVEDGLYWCVVDQRWVRGGSAYEYLYKEVKIPRFILPLVTRNLKKALSGQGTGRHTMQEIDSIMEKDLRALSHFIGSKKFLMGDEPCQEDCTMFGFLVQCKYCLPGTIGQKLLSGELSNLSAYVERMKDRFWPDWNDCLMKKK